MILSIPVSVWGNCKKQSPASHDEGFRLAQRRSKNPFPRYKSRRAGYRRHSCEKVEPVDIHILIIGVTPISRYPTKIKPFVNKKSINQYIKNPISRAEEN